MTEPAGVDTDDGAVTPVFELRDVSVYYGPFRAVRDATLNVAEHEILSLIHI